MWESFIQKNSACYTRRQNQNGHQYQEQVEPGPGVTPGGWGNINLYMGVGNFWISLCTYIKEQMLRKGQNMASLHLKYLPSFLVYKILRRIVKMGYSDLDIILQILI